MNCCAVWPTESRRHDFRQGWAGAGHATHRGSLQGSCVMKKSFSTILLMAALVVASAASAQDLTRYSDEGLRKELSAIRSEEHTSELQSLMRISYAVFCLKKKNKNTKNPIPTQNNKWREQDSLTSTEYQ